MENNAVIKYRLKQETPMIHFQYYEPGACIRPSELKPKLDKFIIEWCTKKDIKIGKDCYLEHAGDKSVKSFNYKVKVRVPNDVELISSKQIEAYFAGSMPGGITTAIYYKEDIEITFLCLKKELRKLLSDKKLIATFFLVNNFGTRQNRGLGCFSVNDVTLSEEKLLKEWFGDKDIYVIDYSDLTQINYINILKDGNIIYKILKSGINFNGIYKKSFLTKYFLNKNIMGEKAAIKANGVAPAIYNKGNEKHKPKWENIKEARYIRAILGTTDMIEYQDPIMKSDDCPLNNNGKKRMYKDRITIKHQDNKIERIPSHLKYSIHNSKLFFITTPIDSKEFNQAFEFRAYEPNKFKSFVPNKERITIKTPAENEFDLDDIISKYVNALNEKNAYIVWDKKVTNNKMIFKEKNIKIRKVGE